MIPFCSVVLMRIPSISMDVPSQKRSWSINLISRDIPSEHVLISSPSSPPKAITSHIPVKGATVTAYEAEPEEQKKKMDTQKTATQKQVTGNFLVIARLPLSINYGTVHQPGSQKEIQGLTTENQLERIVLCNSGEMKIG